MTDGISRRRPIQNPTSACTRCTQRRRVSSLYWYLAFPCLIWTGIWSLRGLDRVISLDRIAQQQQPQQQQQHQDDAVAVVPSDALPVPKIQSQKSQNNNWWATLQQQQQQQQQKASAAADGEDLLGELSVTVSSGVSHPDFLQTLTQRRRELENVNTTNVAYQASSSSSSHLPPWKPAPTPMNQTIPFSDCFLPPPRIPPHSATTHDGPPVMVILVLSASHNVDRRQAIRETWARQQQDQQHPPPDENILIYFVVGHSDCNQATDGTTTNTTIDCRQRDHKLLLQEQSLHQDLLEIPMTESYARLPEKVVQAYHWTLHHIPNVEWLVKADDDTYVRPTSLAAYLTKYNAHRPLWMGKMIPHSRVAREGKWADYSWPNDFYPYWAIGSAGHIVSRAIANYVVEHSATLHRYQGEDVSLGIWLHQWQQQSQSQSQQQSQQQTPPVVVTYIQADRMITNDGTGVCGLADYFLIGHDLTLEEMYDCHLRFHNTPPVLDHENSWIDQPAGFADLVRMEEGMEPAANNVFLRNQFVTRTTGSTSAVANAAGDVGGGVVASNTIFQSGGAKSSYTANQVPRGRKIGYEFPASFRDHLANANN
jgi:hypothetical protein